jgi:hypothetical protein
MRPLSGGGEGATARSAAGCPKRCRHAWTHAACRDEGHLLPAGCDLSRSAHCQRCGHACSSSRLGCGSTCWVGLRRSVVKTVRSWPLCGEACWNPGYCRLAGRLGRFSRHGNGRGDRPLQRHASLKETARGHVGRGTAYLYDCSLWRLPRLDPTHSCHVPTIDAARAQWHHQDASGATGHVGERRRSRRSPASCSAGC